MSDRLTELQRQRALIQGHLDWLDQEIATAKGQPVKPATIPLPVPQAATTAPAAPVSAAMDTQLADEVIAKFETETKDSTQSVRRGCFVFFALAMTILLLGIYGLYRYSKYRHANDPAPKAQSAQVPPDSR